MKTKARSDDGDIDKEIFDPEIDAKEEEIENGGTERSALPKQMKLTIGVGRYLLSIFKQRFIIVC